MQIKSISLVFIVLFCTLESFAQTKMTTTGGTYRLVTSEEQIDDDGLYLVAHKAGTSIYLMSTKITDKKFFSRYTCSENYVDIPLTITETEDTDINTGNPLNNSDGKPYEYRILSEGNDFLVMKDRNDNFIQYKSKSTEDKGSFLTSVIDNDTKFKFSLKDKQNKDYRCVIRKIEDDYILRYETTAIGITINGFRFTSNNNSPPYLYKRISSTASLTISAAGYASLFYGKYDVILPAGLQAFTYTESNGELSISHTYNAGDRIPAGTAVIIKGAAGDYDITIYEPDNNLESPSNVLKGYDTTKETAAEGSNKYYMLSLNESEELSSVGFYYGADNGAAFESGAHRAFLALPSSNSAKPTSFRFSNIEKNNVITGIKRTNNEAPSTLQYFDIQGRKAINHAPSQKARKKTNKGIIIIH